METTSDTENVIFNRREIQIVTEAEKTPSHEEAAKIISDNFKVNSENIVIRDIRGRFGRDTFMIDALVYKTKEDKDKFEAKKKEKKSSSVPQAQEQKK
ncbi:hypothetical protein HYW76_02960 [Candidatus Pacearchaeota archaeon]|nr:hypothetical protein [Candidatus Pacearchaeota archaeon]